MPTHSLDISVAHTYPLSLDHQLQAGLTLPGSPGNRMQLLQNKKKKKYHEGYQSIPLPSSTLYFQPRCLERMVSTEYMLLVNRSAQVALFLPAKKSA